MTPQQEQIELLKKQIADAQGLVTQAQGLGYRDDQTMAQLGFDPNLSYNEAGALQAPRALGSSPLITPKTQGEINAENAQKAQYKAGGITYDAQGNMVFNEPSLADIQAEQLRGFQSEIDALNKYYSEEKAKVLKQQQQITTRQLGQQRAVLGGAGMLGQVSGFGQQEELREARGQAESEAVGMVDAEQQMRLQGIYSKARGDARDIYNAKMSAYSGNLEDIMNAPEKEKEATKQSISDLVKKALAGNLDLETLNVSELAKILKVSEEDIKTEYATQKGILDEAQAEQELKTRQAESKLSTEELERNKLNAEIYQLENPEADIRSVQGGLFDTTNNRWIVSPEEKTTGGTSGTQGTIKETKPVDTTQEQTTIAAIDDLLKSPGLNNAVGPNAFARLGGKLTGERQSFIAGVEKIVSQLSLEKLIEAKSRGATFGALSDKEMQILASSASKIGTWATRDKKGVVGGYNATEKDFKAELKRIQDLAKKAIETAKTAQTAQTEITVVSPEGIEGTIPANQLEEALKQGYKQK